ncbi:MAG: hypothetical protein ACTSRG_21915 [Candidatus Helarchaeota archaeon]
MTNTVDKFLISFKNNEKNNLGRSIKFKRIKVLDAQIQYDFYNINSNTNTFQINDGGVKTITLDLGNYNALELASEIQSKLNAASALTFSVVYNVITGKYTISETGSTVFQLLFTTASDICSVIGFARETLATLFSYEAENISNFRPYSYLGIKLDGYNPGKTFDYYASEGVSNFEDFLFIIPLGKTEFGETCQYNLDQRYPMEYKVDREYIRSDLTFTIYAIGDNSYQISQNGAVNTIVVELQRFFD